MEQKTILIIGDLLCYKDAILKAVHRGCKLRFVPKCLEALRVLHSEEIDVVLIGDLGFGISPPYDRGFMGLIHSNVPVLFSNKEGFKHLLDDVLQESPQDSQSEFGSCAQSRFATPVDDNTYMRLDRNAQNDGQEKNTESGRRDLSAHKGDAKPKKIQERIRKALSFIEDHFDQDLSLDQIAKSAYLSPCHFCRLFKKEVGIPCSKYLSRFRVIKARELLKDSELSVTQICYTIGFNDLTHFERVFKTVEGITPSLYRRTH